jgi:hypothetical protein
MGEEDEEGKGELLNGFGGIAGTDLGDNPCEGGGGGGCGYPAPF